VNIPSSTLSSRYRPAPDGAVPEALDAPYHAPPTLESAKGLGNLRFLWSMNEHRRHGEILDFAPPPGYQRARDPIV
jgi:hypothetical protein